MRFFNKDGIIYMDEHMLINGVKKRIRKSLGVEYSQKNLRKVKQEYEQKKQHEEIVGNFITFEKLFEEYILQKEKEKRIRAETIIDYIRLIKKHVYPFLKGKYMHEITVENLESIKFNILEKNSSQTARNTFNPLRKVFKNALKYKYIKENPMLFVESIRSTKNEEENKIRPFSENEINFLMKKTSKNLHKFIALSFYLGTRPSELVAIKWSDIDLENQNVFIKRAFRGTEKGDEQIKKIKEEGNLKTKSSRRRIFFPKQAIEYLTKDNDSEYVFCTKDNKPYSSQNQFSRDFQNLLKEYGFENHVLYDIRHTYASVNLTKNIISPSLVSKQLGHKNLYTTLKYYADYITNSNDDTIDSINKAFL